MVISLSLLSCLDIFYDRVSCTTSSPEAAAGVPLTSMTFMTCSQTSRRRMYFLRVSLSMAARSASPRPSSPSSSEEESKTFFWLADFFYVADLASLLMDAFLAVVAGSLTVVLRSPQLLVSMMLDWLICG